VKKLQGMSARRWIGWGLVAVLIAGTWGCREEVYHGLSERRANELVVALEREGIRADKVGDPSADGKWMVTVPSGEKVRAWKSLESDGLPKPEVEGFGEFYPTGGLIPTSSEERVLFQYATSQELRKTILKIDGVVDAQVNLVLPEEPRVQLANTEIEPPRASVLVKYTPTRASAETQPVTRAQVKKLVAGGVKGLDRERVEVILTAAREATEDLEDPEFAQVGPVAVAPQSKRALQVVVGVMGLIVVILGGGVVYLLWQRLREPSEE